MFSGDPFLPSPPWSAQLEQNEMGVAGPVSGLILQMDDGHMAAVDVNSCLEQRRNEILQCDSLEIMERLFNVV